MLPLKELFVADVRKLLLIFAGAVAFVFLIACANFANLLLIRGASRPQEIAVRAALGASRWRLIRQLLAESTLVSLAGGMVGVLLSIGAVRALMSLLAPGRIPRAGEIHLDGWVLGFTFGLSLMTGLVFGLAPAPQATRRELREFLFEVTPTDPSTFLAVTGILLMVALLSAWIPAQRAAGLYPLVALRHE
jgi:putative ABC transport system permease protein